MAPHAPASEMSLTTTSDEHTLNDVIQGISSIGNQIREYDNIIKIIPKLVEKVDGATKRIEELESNVNKLQHENEILKFTINNLTELVTTTTTTIITPTITNYIILN